MILKINKLKEGIKEFRESNTFTYETLLKTFLQLSKNYTGFCDRSGVIKRGHLFKIEKFVQILTNEDEDEAGIDETYGSGPDRSAGAFSHDCGSGPGAR